MIDDLSPNQKKSTVRELRGLSPQVESLEMPAQVALLLQKISFVKSR